MTATATAHRSLPRRLLRWAIWLSLAIVLVVATVVVGGAVGARNRLPDLQPWHRHAPPSEVRAADFDERFTLADYLERERRVFDEVRTEVEDVLPPAGDTVNRYLRTSRSSPSRLDRDYNRTFEVEPENLRGGALLMHGLTDAPYSMKAIAEQLRSAGYYSLALRVPGHGTVPAGLVRSGAADWNAAVRLGVRHVRSRIGAGLPLVLVGYSNGGALVTRYTLDALEDPSLTRPDRLVLVSPMFIGNRTTIVRLAAKHRMPAMYNLQTFAEVGGLIAYGPAIDEIWRLGASSIDKILKGARPAELPVQRPTRFELDVNLRTAREIGVEIPQSILLRAERVIE